MTLFALLFVANAASAPVPYEGGAPGATTVSGRVSLAQPVAPRKVSVTKDGDKCGREKADESYVFSPGLGLRNVVVWIEGIPHGKTLELVQVSLDNVTCVYVPHVIAASLGSTLEIHNLDGVQHNTHGYLMSETFGFLGAGLQRPDSPTSLFNVPLPVKGLIVKRKLDHTGIIDVRNDAGHPWMRAWIAVFDQPYFSLTDDSGDFSMAGVPAGAYVLHAWHEAAGERSAALTVPSSGSVNADFVF